MAPVLRRVSQATFDECVQQNIDDFEMDPAEAVEEAVKEFELQGVDLSEIDRTYAGPEGRGEHPVVPLTLALVSAVEAAERDPAAIDAAVAAMAPHVGAKDSAVPGWGASCVGAGAVQAAFRLCVDEAAALTRAREEEEAAAADGEDAVFSPEGSAASPAARLASALALLASVLACDEARDTFAALGYPAAFLADAWASVLPKFGRTLKKFGRILRRRRLPRRRRGVRGDRAGVRQVRGEQGRVREGACGSSRRVGVRRRVGERVGAAGGVRRDAR